MGESLEGGTFIAYTKGVACCSDVCGGENQKMKTKLEYIWLDGYKPTQSLRSKTRIETDFGGTLEECPLWSFDGSSTEQADGSDSDCLLKPVAIFPDPDRNNAFLVMTEVLNADGSPHESNGRATIDDDDDDFENILHNKYIVQPGYVVMECVYIPRFKKWSPINISEKKPSSYVTIVDNKRCLC